MLPTVKVCFGPLQFQCEKVRVKVRVRLFVVIAGLRWETLGNIQYVHTCMNMLHLQLRRTATVSF